MKRINSLDPLAWVGQAYFQMPREAFLIKVPEVGDFTDINATLPSLRDYIEPLRVSCASYMLTLQASLL